jgi:hypothetical protein
MASLNALITRFFKNRHQAALLRKIAGIRHSKVNTLAELKALVDYEDGMTIEVEDLGGAGVGKTYIYDNELVLANDDSTIIIPNNITHPAAGRWRVYCDVASGSVVAGKLTSDPNFAVTETKIADGAVVHTKLHTDAVERNNIKDGTISLLKLSTTETVAAVGNTNIIDANVTHDKFGLASVGTANLVPNSITLAKMSRDTDAGGAAVGETNLTDLCVTNAILDSTLGSEPVSELKFADKAVTAAEFALLTITEAQLADDAVETAEIDNDAVTTLKITDAGVLSHGVTTDKLADAAVTAGKLKYKSVVVGIAGGAAQGSSAIDGTLVDGQIIGWIPVSVGGGAHQTCYVTAVNLLGSGAVQIDLSGAAPDVCTYSVTVLQNS